jgi:hypothetical protein
MKPLKMLLLACFPIVSACNNGPKEDYQAVYQIIPDAHILYLRDHYLLARDNGGSMFLIQADGFGEATYVQQLY